MLGWTVLPGPAWFWTGLVLFMLSWPLPLQLVTGAVQFLHGLLRHLRVLGLPGNLWPTAGQALLSTVFLVDQSRLMLDAVVRTLIRLCITRRRLLEWETAASTERRLGTSFLTFCRSMWQAPALALSLVLAIMLIRPDALPAAMPLLAAWFISPAVAFWVGRPRRPAEPVLTREDRRQLHRLARKTWNFFETFVGDLDHWLPPDNYQEDPKGQLAHRTSPTNIGLYLLSSLAAHDFGYLSLPALLERLEKAFATLDQLERFHGHFYNWYDTRTLQPLQPGYVSTVDSGNFLGCLLALRHGLEEQAKGAVPGLAWRAGLIDVLELVTQAFRTLELPGEVAEPEVIRAIETLLQELDRRKKCSPTRSRSTNGSSACSAASSN